MQGSKKIHFVIRIVPRFVGCDWYTVAQHTFIGELISCLQGIRNALCLVIFLAHSLLRSPRRGWMGCSRTDPQLSASCCGAKSPLGHCDNWTCVSSSNSLLEPLGDTQLSPVRHLQELRGVDSWIMRLQRKGPAGCYPHSLCDQTLHGSFNFHCMT